MFLRYHDCISNEMLPHRHLFISSIVGIGGWALTQDPVALPAAVASGTLPDIDHAADYLWYGLFKEHRLLLPLHGYEYSLPLVLFSNQWWGMGMAAVLTASYLIHLLADQVENQTKPFGYFFLYRLSKRFRLEEISASPVDGANGRLEDFEKLKGLARRFGLMS